MPGIESRRNASCACWDGSHCHARCQRGGQRVGRRTRRRVCVPALARARACQATPATERPSGRLLSATACPRVAIHARGATADHLRLLASPGSRAGDSACPGARPRALRRRRPRRARGSGAQARTRSPSADLIRAAWRSNTTGRAGSCLSRWTGPPRICGSPIVEARIASSLVDCTDGGRCPGHPKRSA